MTNYTHIDMMAQFDCNLPALDVIERTRNPIQVRLILRLPDRLLTPASRLIVDGQPASTPLLPATWTPSMAAMRNTGHSVAVGQRARSASSSHPIDQETAAPVTGFKVQPP
jgi:hypothetical protein